MRHPFEHCATCYCCFCLNFGPQATCYIIAILCITLNAFSGMTNFGIGHWSLYLFSILNFLLHLAAGVLLFLGTIWGKIGLKMAYCWLVFIGIFTVIVAVILFIVYRKTAYVIWDDSSTTLGFVLIGIHAVWLILWDVYTPMIVLGNLYDEVDYCL